MINEHEDTAVIYDGAASDRVVLSAGCQSVRVIAELGINHKGSVDVATELIDIAAAAGAWAIKFQYRNVDQFYQATDQIGDEIISEEIRRTSLGVSDILSLTEYAHERGLRVGVSVFKASDLDDFGAGSAQFDFLKVPSAELMNDDLLDRYSIEGKRIILGTGGHTEEEILERVSMLEGRDVVFLHCISNYPVMTGNQQLSFIAKMKGHTSCAIGYSSHDEDWEVCLLALSEGSEYIERHLTLDKNGGGLDDSSSSDGAEFQKLCKFARMLPAIRGGRTRTLNQGEILNMQNLGTSLTAKRDYSAGECVDEADLVLTVPRNGLTRAQFRTFRNTPLRAPLKKGDAVTEFHYTKFYDEAGPELVEFADKHAISIPVRFHDCAELMKKLNVRNYELHLSYGEVRRAAEDWAVFDRLLPPEKQYSIHLPDYLEGNRLIDPLSADDAARADSVSLIENVRDIAEALSDKTGSAVPIVGSFSVESSTEKRKSLDNIFNYLDTVRTASFTVYPQWLPRIAWYFGGAAKLNLFCDAIDIEYIETRNAEICLDVSHLILSANYELANWREWFDRLLPYARHLHLADASGVDGEGVAFGTGELSGTNRILAVPCRKVLEVWQGHLGMGYGFYEALKFLRATHE